MVEFARWVGVACVAMVASVPATAQTIKQSYDIPAQPLSGALQAFSRVSDREILFSTDIVAGKRSPGVRGRFHTIEALEHLLRGTDLRVTVTSTGALLIAPGSAGPTSQRGDDASVAANAADIIVTAQKRSERLQEVPISIAVLGGTALERSGARGITDELNQVAGVNVIENQPGRAQISIRGASAGGPIGTGSSPVAYYLDEVPFSFITHAIVPDANAFDLDRVEVLKGPQGTLYGSSSLNGVVRILTRDADLDKFEAKGRFRGGFTEGGDPLYGGDVAINLPIVPDKLAIRGVASYSDQGGFIDSPVGTRINRNISQTYRVKLNARLSDPLTIAASAWISRIDNKGPSEGFANYVTPFTSDQRYQYDYESYNLVLKYDFGRFAALSSTGYIDLRTHGTFEYLNVIPVGPPTVDQANRHDSKVFAQELRLTSQFAGPWQVTGGFLYRTINELIDQKPSFFPFAAITKNRSESFAVFGEFSRSFMNDRFKLTGGVRYFNDTLTSDERSAPFTGTLPAALYPLVRSRFDAVTWRAVASYYPSSRFTLYASAATGFRSGVNQDATTLRNDPTLGPVRADKLLTYELGVKGIGAEGHLQYEVAVYYQKWDDPQQLIFTPLGTTQLVNAGSASGFGVSGSVNARITDRLTLKASTDWNGLEFDRDVLQPGATPGSFAILFPKGGRMNTSPEFTAAFGGEYRVPVRDGLKAFLATDFRYNAPMIRNDVVAGVPARTRSDAIMQGTVRVGLDAKRWSANLFIDNVTDERGGIAPAVSIIPTQPRLRPRTYGLQVSFEY